MATFASRLHTFEEYLDLEAAASYKSEFHAGEILAMSGGALIHSRLCSRMSVVLDCRLTGCQVFDSNLKVYVEEADAGVYPDCMALCGEPHFWNNRQDVILNPTVVVEVLSSSTQSYDRGAKAVYYRGVASIQHILLISQELVFLEHLTWQDQRTWTVTQYFERADAMTVLGSEITLEEIYRDILSP